MGGKTITNLDLPLAARLKTSQSGKNMRLTVDLDCYDKEYNRPAGAHPLRTDADGPVIAASISEHTGLFTPLTTSGVSSQ